MDKEDQDGIKRSKMEKKKQMDLSSIDMLRKYTEDQKGTTEDQDGKRNTGMDEKDQRLSILDAAI